MNGAAVALRLVHPEPAPAPSGELEQRLGVAVADATVAVSRGCLEWMGNGLITAKTKALGGDQIANLYWLFQEASGLDFFVIARSQGRRVLLERLGADAHEPTIDVLVDGVIEILTKVTAFMRATAH